MSLPPSPPAEDDFNHVLLTMDTAARIFQSQGEAILNLSKRFNGPNPTNDKIVALFCHSLGLMRQVVLCGGKIVIGGMGKSHKIGSKLVATLHSFGIPAASLHPSDALHGDVGLVSNKDVVILVSASGKSPELAAMIRHLPEGLPTICLTCNENSPLAKVCTGVIAAPLDARHKENTIYGLPAPTISTTLCLVVGDAICVALYESLEQDAKKRRKNFSRWHPGGAIGIANGHVDCATDEGMVVPWHSIPQMGSLGLADCSELALWKSVALSPYICANEVLYKTSDVARALQSGLPLSHLQGSSVALAHNSRGNGLCIYKNELNEPTGVIWD